MNDTQIRSQVQSILHGSLQTPFKQIDLAKVPSAVLLEFLLYNQTDVPDAKKHSFIPNLVKYGFIQLNGSITGTAPKPIAPIQRPSVGISSLQQVQKPAQVISPVSTYAVPVRRGGCSSCPSSVV